MTHQKSFIHHDGRLFHHLGEVPYRTRDGRDIKLQNWSTCCVKEGCGAPLEVRTATISPQTWKNFEPKKYCKKHLRIAKIESVKARAEGQARWLASEEGQEALANRVGHVGKLVLEALEAFLLLDDEGVRAWDLYDFVVEKMDPPAEGKRETRKYRVERAVLGLIVKDKIHVVGSRIRLGPRPPTAK